MSIPPLSHPMLKLWVRILMQTPGGRIPQHVLAAELMHISTENRIQKKTFTTKIHTHTISTSIILYHIIQTHTHTHTHTHTLQQDTSDGFTAGDLVRDVKVYMLCVCVCVSVCASE